jgi:hypothetical protein
MLHAPAHLIRLDLSTVVITIRESDRLKLRIPKVKGKVVTALFLTEHHAMKAYWGAKL